MHVTIQQYSFSHFMSKIKSYFEIS
jgi:hypothetical protein